MDYFIILEPRVINGIVHQYHERATVAIKMSAWRRDKIVCAGSESNESATINEP